MQRLLAVAVLVVLSPLPLSAQGLLIDTDPDVVAPLPRPIPGPTPHGPESAYRI